MTLLCCKNQSSLRMEEAEPWKYDTRGQTPAALLEDPVAYKAWGAKGSTNHLFFCGFEGANPTMRVNDQNRPAKVRAIVVDFDSVLAPKEGMTFGETFKELAGQVLPVELRPTWIAKTISGHLRVAWMLPEPIACDSGESAELAKKFLDIAHKELRVAKIYINPDKKSLSPEQIWDVGMDWEQWNTEPLDGNLVSSWLFKAAKKSKLPKGEVDIPIADVWAEVQRKWPETSGTINDFSDGARCHAFFDPDSTNPSSCIITPQGLVTFSQEKAFYSWRELLGPKFIEKYIADKIGGAVRNIWFDGEKFWRKIGDRWVDEKKEILTTIWKTQHHLSSNPGHNPFSEIDSTVAYIVDNQRVDGVTASLYNPQDIISINGCQLLNIARARVMQPHEDPQGEWGVTFPQLAEVAGNMFDPAEHKDIFLAWFRRFYKSAYEHNLLAGHCLCIAGPTNSFKSFLVERILYGAMGGMSDLAAYATGTSDFNAEIFDTPLAVIDDNTVASNETVRRKYTAIVKKLTAHRRHSSNRKYNTPQMGEWSGRVVIALNDDPISIQMLPDLDMSNDDKIIVLKSKRWPTRPDPAKLKGIEEEELPRFLRWLLDWTPPAHLIDDTDRFGMPAFINEDIRVAALHGSDVAQILEQAHQWWKHRASATPWEGGAYALMEELTHHLECKETLRGYTVNRIGILLKKAASIAGSGIEILEKDNNKHKGANSYRIDLGIPEPIDAVNLKV